MALKAVFRQLKQELQQVALVAQEAVLEKLSLVL